MRDLYPPCHALTQEEKCRRSLRGGGYALICGLPPTRASLLDLGRHFGRVIRHELASPDGIYDVRITTGERAHCGRTSAELAPHTDSPFLETPPTILVLQCVVPARTGGLTLLVDGRQLHQSLLALGSPRELSALDDPLPYTRGIHRLSRQLFIRSKDRVQISYRSDCIARAVCNSAQLALCERVDQYISSRRRQEIVALSTGDILVIDNKRTLHGRTGFPAADRRHYRRLWCDGSLQRGSSGFVPMVASQPGSLTSTPARGPNDAGC